ncbi:MAG: hypothetical protein HUJ91_00795 [Bacteroidales bacterium]|nr:hypothetical protein [Bacteroidales bacterium]
MKKVLSFVGGVIYSLLLAYLLWLIFYHVTPYIMGIKLLWIMTLFIIFGAPILAYGLYLAAGIISIPLLFLSKNTKTLKYLSIIPLIVFAFSTIADPWRLSIQYNYISVILGIFIDITALYVFGMAIVALFQDE